MIKIFRESAPKGLPPDLLEAFVDMLKTQFRAGVSSQEILEGLAFAMGMANQSKQKGGRKSR